MHLKKLKITVQLGRKSTLIDFLFLLLLFLVPLHSPSRDGCLP